ncbi:MAG TPA: GNAT family protein [Burkholderiaceae bacterium]|nr:GNAT family protein [Burkholderiaceae bacterium]HQR71761.1 GNAT family protein [Burkholderiaceae bacterium]
MAIELRPLMRATAPAASDFLAAAQESAESLARWMPWYHPGYGLSDVERWFDQADRMWRERSAFPMLVFDADAARLLGGVALHDVQLFGKREAEVGYWVRRTARSHGVAATAIRSMAAFGVNELGLIRVAMRIRLDNRSSRRAAERAGARFEGVLRHGLLAGEVRCDAALYSLLPSDLARPWSP